MVFRGGSLGWRGAGTILLLIALWLGACGGESSDKTSDRPTPPARQQVVGVVVLPAGVSAASVINSLAEAPVVDAGFTLEMFATADGAGRERQFTAALSPSGAPLLMGWFGPASPELSARTTAEVLVWFASGAFSAPLESADDLMTLLRAAPELDPLAEAITAQLQATPTGFSTPNPALTAALADCVRALLGSNMRVQSLLINPASELSGVRVDQASGVNEITLTNRYRRPAFAFVDRVSTFDAAGNETASPAEVARVELPAVTGLKGGVGTINQIITGLAQAGASFEGADLAYTEKSAAPLALPNLGGARKTRYQVAVVGPGAFDGDIARLGAEAKQKQTEIMQKFVVQQLFLPLVTQFLLPSVDLDRIANLSAFGDLVQDFINIIAAQAPAIFSKANSGDFKGAVTLGAQTIVGSATFRNAVFAATLERLYDLRTEAGNAAYGRASAVAAGFIHVTGALDTFLGAFDLTAVAASFAQSNQGDLWVVDATDTIVRLSPPTSDVKTRGSVRLSATLPGVGDDVALAYRYSVTPTELGTLRNARGRASVLDSSEDFIFFEAGDTEGEVTVKVEVFQIDNAARIPLGDASATVRIEEGCEFGPDAVQTVAVQHYTGVSLNTGGVQGNDMAIAYWYFVWELTPGITSYKLTFHAGPDGRPFGNSTPQFDGNTINIRPVQPLGNAAYRYSTAATLARHTYDLFAGAVALSDTQGLYVVAHSAQPLNATQAQLPDFLERVASIDLDHQGVTADIVPNCE